VSILVISHTCHIKRNVYVKAPSSTLPYVLSWATFASWIEFTIVISVYWYEQNRVIIKQNFWSPIPKMHVPIKNDNLFSSILFLSISSTVCYIIEEAETRCHWTVRMMAWRPYDTKSILNEIWIDSIDHLNHPACCKTCAVRSPLVFVSAVKRKSIFSFL